jgi:Tol biopolymer transport system component
MNAQFRRLWLCAACALLPLALIFTGYAAAEAWIIQLRVTTYSELYRTSTNVRLSGQGNKMVFVSDSDFLSQSLPAGQFELWHYNESTLKFTRLTTASHPGRVSRSPSLNENGRIVAFESDSALRGQNILSGQFEIWLFNFATLTYTRITTASLPDRDSHNPSLSADGEKIAFESNSDFLNQGIPGSQFEIWLYDTEMEKYTRITRASLPGRSSTHPSISADGTRIAFESDSDFFNQGLPLNPDELWLYDTATLTYTRLTTTSHFSRRSTHPAISADGTRIAFQSDSDFFHQGIITGQYEIWLFDTTTMTLTRITTSTEPGERISIVPDVNADGTRIVFESDNDFLNEGIPNNLREIWLYDTTAMTFTRLTTAQPYATTRDSRAPSISDDGYGVAFHSDSSFNLPFVLPDDQFEVWLFKQTTSKAYVPVLIKNFP